MDIFFLVLEYVGIAAFAVSGAMVAIDKEADFLGVVFLALTTSFGGGILRDLILDINPPFFFTSYKVHIIIATCIAVAVFICAVALKKKYVSNEKKINSINNIFDAIGIGIFSSSSTLIAIEAGYTSPLIAITMGLFASVGGGLLRDLMLREIPFIIKKRIYALACIAGSSVFYILYMVLSVDLIWSTFLGVMTTFLLRLCATAFKWNLPRAIDFSALESEDRKFNKENSDNTIQDLTSDNKNI